MSIRERTHTAVLLGVAILWQAYIATIAFRSAATLRSLLKGLGAEPSVMLQIFFASYLVWPAIPVVFAIAGLAILRRQEMPLLHSSILLVSAFLTGFAMHALVTEIAFGTIFDLISMVR